MVVYPVGSAGRNSDTGNTEHHLNQLRLFLSLPDALKNSGGSRNQDRLSQTEFSNAGQDENVADRHGPGDTGQLNLECGRKKSRKGIRRQTEGGTHV